MIRGVGASSGLEDDGEEAASWVNSQCTHSEFMPIHWKLKSVSERMVLWQSLIAIPAFARTVCS